jgi:ASC-1-like (ASCH) protein
LLGVAAATPKKGEPIKLMPLVATSPHAFFALISDVPRLLGRTGHKVYLHVVPNSEETMLLQRAGWSLDAVLPDAYQAGIATQQWSIDQSEETLMRTMRLKQRFLNQIRAGTKQLEVRVAYDNIKRIKKGDRIKFLSRDDQVIVSVTDVRNYDSFKEMLLVEDAGKILPGSNASETQDLLEQIYPREKEELGIVVIQLAAS